MSAFLLCEEVCYGQKKCAIAYVDGSLSSWLLNMVLTMGLMITVKNKNDKVSKGEC